MSLIYSKHPLEQLQPISFNTRFAAALNSACTCTVEAGLKLQYSYAASYISPTEYGSRLVAAACSWLQLASSSCNDGAVLRVGGYSPTS